MILLGLTDTARALPKHRRQSMLLVPMDAKGVSIERCDPNTYATRTSDVCASVPCVWLVSHAVKSFLISPLWLCVH